MQCIDGRPKPVHSFFHVFMPLWLLRESIDVPANSSIRSREIGGCRGASAVDLDIADKQRTDEGREEVNHYAYAGELDADGSEDDSWALLKTLACTISDITFRVEHVLRLDMNYVSFLAAAHA